MLYGFMVYWTEIDEQVAVPCQRLFNKEEMVDAIGFMEELRSSGIAQFVNMVSQDPNCVGKPGVNGKLPEDYSWSKKHRAGAKQQRQLITDDDRDE